jgi:hypothetical protein
LTSAKEGTIIHPQSTQQESKMFDREQVIENLINNDLEYDSLLDMTTVDVAYFEQMMRQGFKGYDNMTDEELMDECNERDISYLVGDDDDIQRLKDEKNGLYPDAWDIAN